MEPAQNRRHRRTMNSLGRTAAMMLGTIPIIHTQPAPRFDVAAVTLCRPSDTAPAGGRGGGGNYGTSPGRLHVHCMSVDALVKLAYTVNDPLINSNGIADKPPVRGGPRGRIRASTR